MPLQTQQFSSFSCDMVEEKLNKMTPKQLIAAFGMFESDDVKDRLMEASIAAFKQMKIDIRLFEIE